MEIISHRGYWKTPQEKNRRVAFERSFALGFGTETDFRDWDGNLVISHDPATRMAMPAGDVVSLLVDANPKLPLAINIKADGLQNLIRHVLHGAELQRYFLFDMSVPDALQSIRAGLPIYTRQSDIEMEPVLYAEAVGVWMDAFRNYEWITADRIRRHLDNGKDVCLVSPELHGRSHAEFWDRLAVSDVVDSKQLLLCTDYPEDARRSFPCHDEN